MITTEQSIITALTQYAKITSTGADCLLIERNDAPHVLGHWFYAIRPADKHAWTPGERALTESEIADLWYEAGCPPNVPALAK